MLRITKTPERMNVIATSNHPLTINLKNMTALSEGDMKPLQNVKSRRINTNVKKLTNTRTTYMWIACWCPRMDRTATRYINELQRDKKCKIQEDQMIDFIPQVV